MCSKSSSLISPFKKYSILIGRGQLSHVNLPFDENFSLNFLKFSEANETEFSRISEKEANLAW